MHKTTCAAIAGAAIAAGALGVLVGRTSLKSPTAPIASKASNPDEDAGVVAFPLSHIRAAGIEVVKAERSTLSPEVIAQGSVASAPGAEAILAARADGVLVRQFKRLGDPVRSGEEVALIESREASTIAADRAKANALLQTTRAKYAREKRLFEGGVTAKQDFEAARAELADAEAEARRTAAAQSAAGVSRDGRSLAVVSPVAGRVSASPAVLGAFVTAGAEIYRVVDPGRTEIRAAVPTADASLVTVGDLASVEVAGAKLTATVRAVTPDVDPISRSTTVVLVPAGGAGRLNPGQAARVRIETRSPTRVSAIVVPTDAVQLVAGRDVVFVRTRTGFRAQPVTLGPRNGDDVMIASGLQPGQLVAARNAFLVKAELAKPDEGDAGR